MRQVLLVGSLLVTCASVALIGQMRVIPDAPGRWKPWTFTASGGTRTLLGARPADVKGLEAQLLRLNEIIKGTEGITSPIGFSVETSGSLGMASPRSTPIPGEPALTVRPLPAMLTFGAFPIREYGSGATTTREDGGETALLLFFVNELSLPLFAAGDGRVPEFETLDVDVVRLARPEPDVFGLPRYGKDAIVIKKSDAPIWTAVTMGETLALVARSIDRRLADQRDVVARHQAQYDDRTDSGQRAKRMAEYKQIASLQTDPTAFMDQMTKVEDELARTAADLLPTIASAKADAMKIERELADARATAEGLSAADKAAPGCYASGSAGGGPALARFRRAPDAGCDPLVRPNWSMFNPALPRSAPQVLIISRVEGCLDANRPAPHPGGCTANLRLLESIDKAALLAWLQ